MASVYAPSVEPPDFHAVVEVYLDGAWRLADPTGMARPGDTVILMGKGHETYQHVGDVKEPFDEKAIVAGLMG